MTMESTDLLLVERRGPVAQEVEVACGLAPCAARRVKG